MKRRIGHYLGSAGILVAALCIVFLPAFSQEGNAPSSERLLTKQIHKLAPGGPAPRAADGHPDLSGVWYPNSAGVNTIQTTLWNPSNLGALGAEAVKQRGDLANPVDADATRQFDPKVTPEQKPSFQPWMVAKMKAMTAAERSLASGQVKCLPRGVPAVFIANPYPIQIISTQGEFVQLFELLNNFRVVHTDGRPHKKNPDPGFNGDETAHWDGDTLVIDTIALDDRAEIGAGFILHSDQIHVIERLSRPSMNYLVYQVTIEDPKVLTKPWTSAPRNWTLAQDHSDLAEYYCTRDDDVKEISKIVEEEKQAKK